jgi:hypothetical protein
MIMALAASSIISCNQATYSLGAGYHLLRLGGRSIDDNYYCITDNKGSFVVPERITKLENSRALIIGYSVNDPWPPERPDFYKGIPPIPFEGYFIIDKKRRQIHLGLTEEEFQKKLKELGHTWPPNLQNPSKWLR